MGKGRSYGSNFFPYNYNFYGILSVEDRESEVQMLALSEKKRDSNNNYLKQLEDIKIRVPKGYRDVIKNLANEEGYDGVNPFVISLVNNVLREKGREEIPNGIKETKSK